MEKFKDLSLNYKIWLSSQNGADVLGGGKWLLLKAIDEEGSLMAAAEKLGISYRKAWGGIKKAEENLGFLLVEKYRGGKAGGKSELTADGKRLIAAYEKFINDFRKSADKVFVRFIKQLN